MMRLRLFGFLVLLNCVLFTFVNAQPKNPIVRMETSKGDIIIELFQDKAPITCENFLQYVDDGFYDNTIFHRVIRNFVVQGGGFVAGLRQRKTRDPIKNEANNKISNSRGTLAMARTSVVDSATSQFFINLNDNKFLDYRNNSPQGYGYAVFGKVISGMEVVDRIQAVKTIKVGVYSDVPKEDITVNKVSVLRNYKENE